MNDSSEFEIHWKAVRQDVWRACYRSAHNNYADAEDLLQEVAWRAWRGYPTFRKHASFKTWVMTITGNTAAYHFRRRSNESKNTGSLDDVQTYAPSDLPSIAPPRLPEMPRESMEYAVEAARDNNSLTENEAAVILTRLRMEEDRWELAGNESGLSPKACAVLYHRAVPKLRVFLFISLPDLLGGREIIQHAYQSALLNHELSADQADAFRRIVLEADACYHRAGWRTALRTACEIVINHIKER